MFYNFCKTRTIYTKKIYNILQERGNTYLSEEYYSLRSPWREMSYCKYPPLSQHERLVLEYELDKQDFEIEQLEKDEDVEIEYIWGGW